MMLILLLLLLWLLLWLWWWLLWWMMVVMVVVVVLMALLRCNCKFRIHLCRWSHVALVVVYLVCGAVRQATAYGPIRYDTTAVICRRLLTGGVLAATRAVLKLPWRCAHRTVI
jgi:hypothetical protein